MAAESHGLRGGIIRRMLDHVRRHLRDVRGFTNTVDMAVAAGGTIVLAAVVATTSLGALEQPKIAKDQQTADAIVNAMTKFFQDTGKWPGQAEMVAGETVTGRYLTTNISGTLPTFQATVSTAPAVCKNNSLEGFVGKSISAVAQPGSAGTTLLDINAYLVTKPAPLAYPNWKGPYLQAAVTEDSFGRVFVINTMPLFCAESLDSLTPTQPGGNLGFAWVLAGGGNRTVTTALNALNLDATGDDAGKNAGKLVQKSNAAGS